MNQTTKAQAPKTLLSEYEKFHFLTHEDAKKAAMLLGEKYPGIIFKASHSGSLFAKTGGSLILWSKIVSDVTKLGGAAASGA